MRKAVHIVVDEARQTPEQRITAVEDRFRRVVRRNTFYFFGLLIVSILASALPAALVQQVDASSGFLKVAIAVLAIVGAALTAIEGAVGTRARWKAARSTWNKVIQLSNTYAANGLSDKEAMERLNTILEEHEVAEQGTVK